MKNLKAKLRKNGGFTLIEMLIVVAIIAILIAVSIPLVGNALEKARDATDQANERAAKAEALIIYMVGIDATDTETKVTPDGGTAGGAYTAGKGFTANYNANTGRLTTDVPTGYGKCTGTGHYTTEGVTQKSGGNDGGYLEVKVDTAGKVTMTWK